eukprot:1195678-Prorocentrum_minimum.AAC.5
MPWACHFQNVMVPWWRLMRSPRVWAIVTNNFTFHYAFFVILSWLPTFTDQCAISAGVRPELQLVHWSAGAGRAADHRRVPARPAVPDHVPVLQLWGVDRGLPHPKVPGEPPHS